MTRFPLGARLVGAGIPPRLTGRTDDGYTGHIAQGRAADGEHGARGTGVPAPRAAGRGGSAPAGRGARAVARPARGGAAAGPERHRSAARLGGAGLLDHPERQVLHDQALRPAGRRPAELAPRRRRAGQAAAEPDARPGQGPSAAGGHLHPRVLRQSRASRSPAAGRQRHLGRHAAGAAAPGGRHPGSGQGDRVLRARHRQAEGPRHGADDAVRPQPCRSPTR